MKFLKWFYDNLGNNKCQRFWHLIILIFILGIIIISVLNVGYDRTKNGIYLKPLDIQVRQNITK